MPAEFSYFPSTAVAARYFSLYDSRPNPGRNEGQLSTLSPSEKEGAWASLTKIVRVGSQIEITGRGYSVGG